MKIQKTNKPTQKKRKKSLDKFEMPSLDEFVNIYDFESMASKVMGKEGWGYYSSGGDDEITLRENEAVFARIWFRPRVLIDVSQINMNCKILGYDSSFPVYITATALGKLAHESGELALARAAYNHNIIQMIPTLGSYALEDVCKAKQQNQVSFMCIYSNFVLFSFFFAF